MGKPKVVPMTKRMMKREKTSMRRPTTAAVMSSLPACKLLLFSRHHNTQLGFLFKLSFQAI
jgi:hypothetical protein